MNPVHQQHSCASRPFSDEEKAALGAAFSQLRKLMAPAHRGRGGH